MTDTRKPRIYKGYTIEPCMMQIGHLTVKGWQYVDERGRTHKSRVQRYLKQGIDTNMGRDGEMRQPTPTGFRAVYERYDGPETRYLTESERLHLRQCTGRVRSIMVDPVATIW